MIEQFIKQLRKDLEYEEPSVARDDGSYVIDFEPDLHITVTKHIDGSLRLFCLLAPLPKEKREEFLKSCMVGNLFGLETGGTILGVDDSEKNLCLSCCLPGDLKYREFRDALEDFVNYADVWRQDALVFAEVNSEN